MPTEYVESFVRKAGDEVSDFGGFLEDSPEVLERIRFYARFLEIGIPHELHGYHWSGLFTSYCVKAAGANRHEFPFSAKHSIYVHAAAVNARNGRGVFRA